MAICIAFAVGTLIVATASWQNPFSDDLSGAPIANAIVDGIFVVGAPLFAGVIVASFVSAALRFREATRDERLQLKWFASAAALVAVTFILGFFLDNPVVSVLGPWRSRRSTWPSRSPSQDRLYDIDVVIGGRWCATLVAFITVVYIALVVGVGTLVGDREVPLSALAAALVARRLTRCGNGRGGSRTASSTASEPRRTRCSRTSRRARRARTDRGRPAAHGPDPRRGDRASEGGGGLHVGSEPGCGRLADERGPSAGVGPRIRAAGLPGARAGVPGAPGGQLLGAITVVTPAAEPLAADRERLLGDIAAQTALVLRNVRLIEELRESRRRIVATQDARAKALERNLHDGAQQQLVALAVKQRLAEGLVERDPERTKAMLAEIQADTQDALETLRDLARGVYPPLLADQGLGAALAAQARKAAVPVEVEAGGTGRYPQDIEATVDPVLLQALQNVAKYAEASRVTVRLSAGGGGGLVFEVRDDGIGFDPASAGRGSGLQGMADRLDAIGGALEVRSTPGAGASVVGRIPARSLGLGDPQARSSRSLAPRFIMAVMRSAPPDTIRSPRSSRSWPTRSTTTTRPATISRRACISRGSIWTA